MPHFVRNIDIRSFRIIPYQNIFLHSVESDMKEPRRGLPSFVSTPPPAPQILSLSVARCKARRPPGLIRAPRTAAGKLLLRRKRTINPGSVKKHHVRHPCFYSPLPPTPSTPYIGHHPLSHSPQLPLAPSPSPSTRLSACIPCRPRRHTPRCRGVAPSPSAPESHP